MINLGFLKSLKVRKNGGKELFQDLKLRFSKRWLCLLLVGIAILAAYTESVGDLLLLIGENLTKDINNILLLSILSIIIFLWFIGYQFQKSIKGDLRGTSTSVLTICVFTISIWTIYRYSKRWIVLHLFSDSFPIGFVDLLFCIAVFIVACYIASYLFKIEYEPKQKNCRFKPLLDNAIEKRSQDKFFRETVVNNVYNYILDVDVVNSSYSLALVAPWGTGKSSVLNLLEEKIKQDKTTNIKIIRFNPWYYSSSTNIIYEFFNQLSSIIGENNSTLVLKLNTYGKLLSGKPIDVWSKFVDDIFDHDTDVADLYYTICKRLKLMEQKYLVLIDDIDRLEPTEILDVFRLIRGSANFPNIIFVSTFDKSYVIETLSNYSSAINPGFIDKFFQSELIIPNPSWKILKEHIKNNINDYLLENDKEKFDDYLNGRISLNSSCPLYEHIVTYRDLIRWVNSFLSAYQQLKGDVIISDLCDVVLLKQFYPELYFVFASNPETFILRENYKVILWSKDEEDKAKAGDKFYNVFRKRTNADLLETDAFKRLDESSKNKVLAIFKRILNYNGFEVADKSFAKPFYTQRYLNNELSYQEISIESFYEIISLNYWELIKKMREMDDDVYRSFRYHLNNDCPKDDQELIEKLIKASFYIGSIDINRPISIDKLCSMVDSLSLSDNGKFEFIKSCLTENGYTPFAPHFLSAIKNYQSEWTKQLVKESKDILLYILSKTIESGDIKKSFDFYQDTVDRESENQYIHNPEACKMIRKLITSHPTECISRIIHSDFSPGGSCNQYIYGISLWSLNFWNNSWDEFERDLKKMPKEPKINVFRKFYNQFKNNNYEYIEYEFPKDFFNA